LEIRKNKLGEGAPIS